MGSGAGILIFMIPSGKAVNTYIDSGFFNHGFSVIKESSRFDWLKA